jgi:HEAT repeat protein
MQRWPKDAILPIERALLNESIVWNKIEMADDLFRSGDPLGRETLVSVCHDLTVGGSARMAAANRLVPFKDDSCRDSVLSILKSATDLQDTDAKEQALMLAPALLGQSGTEQYRTVFQLLTKSLRDPAANVRVIASAMLGQIGDPAAIPSLEAAIAKERDNTYRTWMSNSLAKLRMKNRRK